MWLLSLLFAMLAFLGTFRTIVPQIAADPDPASLMELVNAERTEAGLPSLTPESVLDDIAADRVGEIRTDFSHGNRLGRLAWDYGFRTELLGENLGRTEHDEARIVDMWMNSEIHRAFILGSWTRIGTAAYSEGGITWAVVVFR